MLCVVLASRELEDRSAAMRKQHSAPWQTELKCRTGLMAVLPIAEGAS